MIVGLKISKNKCKNSLRKSLCLGKLENLYGGNLVKKISMRVYFKFYKTNGTNNKKTKSDDCDQRTLSRRSF